MADDAPDEALMQRYCQGDAGAFDTLYHRHKGALYRYLLRQCSQSCVAEELFQDIWMRIIAARQRYRPSATFKTFLFTVAHNRLIDHYRRQNALPRSYQEVPDSDCVEAHPLLAGNAPVEDILDTRQQVERLFALIAALPEAQREAFLLQEEAGLSIEQIAAATGVNRETAKSRVRYAVAKLRQGMRDTV